MPSHKFTEVSGPISGRFLYRRYFEVDRIVIVWQSIVDDECFPVTDDTLVLNQRGWYVVWSL